jgi:hypothetical protein
LKCFQRDDAGSNKLSCGDFLLVFVVPDHATEEKYLQTWANGKTIKVGEEEQTLPVGVLVIDANHVRTLDVRGRLSAVINVQDLMFAYKTVAPEAIDKDGHKAPPQTELASAIPTGMTKRRHMKITTAAAAYSPLPPLTVAVASPSQSPSGAVQKTAAQKRKSEVDSIPQPELVSIKKRRGGSSTNP